MTNPHNFTLDSRTELLWLEFVSLARKHNKTVSQLIRNFIVDYVEANNPVLEVEVEIEEEPIVPLFEHDRLLEYRKLNPWPIEHDNHWKWEERYGHK